MTEPVGSSTTWPSPGPHDGPVVVGVVRDQPGALEAAMVEAMRRGSVLRVVHAAGSTADDGQAVLDDARSFVRQAPVAPTVEYVLSHQGPLAALLQEAQTASCLVVGTDEVTWFERLVGGEVSTRLARLASCAVLVVPESAPQGIARHDVVLALDVGTSAGPALAAAFEQAERRRSRLRVLHATESDGDASGGGSASGELARLVAREQQGHPEVRVVAHTVRGEADAACLKAGERAGLLVLGRPRPLRVGGLLSRPVALRVLRAAHCPVLVATGEPARP